MLHFSKLGYLFSSRRWVHLTALGPRAEGQTIIVTGANSGLGFWLSGYFAHYGANLYMVCRDSARGQQAFESVRSQAKYSDRVHLEIADLSERLDVDQLAFRLIHSCQQIDVLIHNAGLLVHERTLNSTGDEITWAVGVVSPVKLTDMLLLPLAQSPRARVIFVSSGGQYGRKLNLSDVNWQTRKFDGVGAYAEAKRAQVVLAQEYANREKSSHFFSMHPGWVATPGLQKSLPAFAKITAKILRSPLEGADTVAWLALEDIQKLVNGGFYFDRRKVATDWLASTKVSALQREQLWQMLHQV